MLETVIFGLRSAWFKSIFGRLAKTLPKKAAEEAKETVKHRTTWLTRTHLETGEQNQNLQTGERNQNLQTRGKKPNI